MSLLGQAAIFFGAAVIAVPLTKRLGLGAVLGYLGAGAVIGPWGLGLIGEVESTLHFAEIGVVLLLFVIGLELQPSRLWTMRKSVFGLGALQVGISAVLLGLIGLAFGLPWLEAVVVGLGLSLSSTAFALQTLAEKGQMPTRHGRAGFSILLFQDLAVIPILALLPLFSPSYWDPAPDSAGRLLDIALTVGVVAGVILGGHYLLRPGLRLIAASGIREVFTAFALLTVLGTALIMQQVGLSMALGAFVAGVLLADSEYRHALEADIEPFKGLLLGLFFMAVGMSVNMGLLVESPLLVAALVAGLILVKMAVLYGLGRIFGLGQRSALYLAAAISQGGEFAFVIFGMAVGGQILAREVSDLLILVVTLSMAVTPLLILAVERFATPPPEATAKEDSVPAIEEENRVIIAGFGRFGQIVGRVLRARRIGFTALEASSAQVDFVKKFGNKVYYGDASRLDLLRAAKADQARIFVLAMEDVEASLRTAQTVTRHFPHLTVYARARNREHAYKLMDLGIAHVTRETFHSGLEVARSVLGGLGHSHSESTRIVETFRQHDERRLLTHRDIHQDADKMAEMAQSWAKELEEIFEADEREDREEQTASR